MRKQSVIIAVLAVFAMTMMLSACGISTTVSKLQSVSVDVTNAKTEFFTGEEFSADGIKVTAEIKMANSNTPTIKTLSASEYKVNSDSYNKFQPGKYTIRVSYTFEGETKTTTYDVTVGSREYDGISVELSNGVADTYHLTSPVEIDTKAIVVKQTDQYGNLLDEVAEGYTTTLYRGKEEVALSDGKATITEGGAYQIWVEKPSSVQPFYTLKAFVTVYVLDDVLTLTFDETAEGTLTTQEEGSDVISETWKFTVTYESGKTKTVSAEDVDFTVKPDTSKAGENLTASATYTEKNAKSEKVTTSEATVTYNVTEKQVPSESEITVTANANDLPLGDITENTVLADGITLLATAEKKVTVDGNKKTFNGIEFTQRIKLNGKGNITARNFKFDAPGKGTVTLYAITGSSSDTTRTLSLYNAAGEALATSEGLPNAVTEVVFEIPAAGTYYVWASAAINVYYVSLYSDLSKTVSVNISDLEAATLTEEMVLCEGVSITATASKTIVIDANEKELNGVTFTKRLKLGGKGAQGYRSFKIDAQGKGTVTLYAITGSSSDTTRTLSIYNVAGETLATSEGLPNKLTEVTFEIPAAGTYYIWCSAAINVYYLSLTTVPTQATVDTYNFSLQELIDSITTVLGTAPADKTALKADYFTGANAFLTLGGSLGSSDQYRTSSGGCFEIKKGTLSVTFQGTGTLTVAFASTGGSNKSRLALMDSTGAIVAAQKTETSTAALVTDGIEDGAYEVSGTAFITLSFEITQPGTYTICAKYGVQNRGVRINAISMTDNH